MEQRMEACMSKGREFDLSGRRVLVTGASNGVGLAASTEFARAGADVVLHVRDEARGEAARERIAAETGSERTELLLADFADLGAVASAAEEYARRHDRLDVLVANAGAIMPKRIITAHGNELTFQVNHLAHFLLCRILGPLLAASAPARVVTVSSDAHQAAWRGIRFGDITYERGWLSFTAYAHSKLANIMFCYEHARRLFGTGVTSTVMHPGFVHSHFGADAYGRLNPLIYRMIYPAIGRTPERGADTVVWLAASPEVDGITGTYFQDRRMHPSSRASMDLGAQRRLWELSEELVCWPGTGC